MSAITINGTAYEADLSDLYIVRDLMAAVSEARALSSADDPVAATISFAEHARDAIARAIGQENAAEAFGDKLVLSVILGAVNDLAAEVGPAYERMLSDLTR